MRALMCKEWGPPEQLQLEDIPAPQPGKGQIVVDVKAASVNFPDTLIIQNLYQFKPDLPFAPGSECAGIVRSIGEGVTRFKPGDRVTAMTLYGSFAEQVVCDEQSAISFPEGVDFVAAASFVMTHGTSYHALVGRGQLQPGETLLVLGASGGVGLAAVEIGKQLGARVIAAASSDEKLKACKQYGADELINYCTENLRDRIKEITGGKGVDIAYDPVGGELSEAALRSCGWRGRLLVVGFASGEIPKAALNIPLLKGSSIIGVFFGDYMMREPDNYQRDLVTLFEWLAKGKLKPLIAGEYSLENGGNAIRALMERSVSGKVVITP